MPGSLLTAEEVATRLSVPTSWVYKQVSAKRIPFVKIGRYVRFEPEAIERYIEQKRALTVTERVA